MNDYGAINYKRTFINQVIVRVDFLQLLETEKLFSENIEKVILKLFSRRGMDQKIRFDTINVSIDPDRQNPPNAHKETIEGIRREYNAGKNKLFLSNKFIIFEINEYKTFEDHYQIIQSILFTLFSNLQISTARIGIRYINIFNPEDIRLKKNMFSSEISSTFNAKEFVSENGINLIRAMRINEYQVSNMTLNFRFGLFNPDYPNPLAKNSFSLDYDCYTTEPFENAEDILRAFSRGHDAIQELFEASITDSLRKVLSNG